MCNDLLYSVADWESTDGGTMAVGSVVDAALEVAKLQQNSIRMLRELCEALRVRCDDLEIRVRALEDERR